jgi:malate dehydrogenase (quinone)
MTLTDNSIVSNPDVVLIGAGIMSATLGMLLKELNPALKISIYERLEVMAGESSNAMNNAGTGHTGFCELNYTPQKKDNSIDISKALEIASNFEETKQFWAYLVKEKKIANAGSFIKPIPHLAFVKGEENVEFLKKRHEMLTQNELFEGMVFSDNRETISKWIPLYMTGRDSSEKVGATYIQRGTDVNYGALTKFLFEELLKYDDVNIFYRHEVKDLDKVADGRWSIKIKDLATGKKIKTISPFVFIGAGGRAQILLEKTRILEAQDYAGFPISGQFLVCHNEDIISQHNAKVYGLASVGAPPMSVPHLDTRVIKGHRTLLFGPFAGFSTKFLKKGSYWDWFQSMTFKNIIPMFYAGIHNIPLTKYLIKEVLKTSNGRMKSLREYYPNARKEDWKLAIAGQRVQIIKKDEKEGGKLNMGTEVVSSADGSLAALLGASPGASIAVKIMIDLIKKCFKDEFQSEDWQKKLKLMIPSYGLSLKDNAELCKTIRTDSDTVLGINA